MRIRSRLALVCATAALGLAVVAGAATAGKFSLSSRNFRVTWSQLIFKGGPMPLTELASCPVTMEGSFHSATIRKVRGASIGHVTRMVSNEAACVGEPAAVFLPESMPWEIFYLSFSGTLPNITGMQVLIEETRFMVIALFNPFTFGCLFQQAAARSLQGRFIVESGNQMTLFEWDENTDLPQILEEEFLCIWEEGWLTGIGSVRVLGTTNIISIRLI